MELKDLIKDYKSIKPDPALEHKSKEMLLDYFKQTFPRQTWFNINYYIYILRPAAVSLLVLLFVFISGFGLFYGSKNTLPGNFLYSVKLYSEKARMTLSFDQSKKTVLRAEILTNRLSEVKFLAEKVEQGNKEFELRLAGLTKNFTDELQALKKHIQAQVPESSVEVGSGPAEQDEVIPFSEEELLATPVSLRGASEVSDEAIFISDPASLPIQDEREIFTVIQSQELKELLLQTKEFLAEQNLKTALATLEQAEKIASPSEEPVEQEQEPVLQEQAEEQIILPQEQFVPEADEPLTETINQPGSLGQIFEQAEQEQSQDFNVGRLERSTSYGSGLIREK